MPAPKLPKGFSLSTARAAIKGSTIGKAAIGKAARDDMALIASSVPAVASALFTTNRIKGAPVLLNMKHIKSGLGRAVLINSGNANACTGPQGIEDATEMASMVAGELGVPLRQVYVCSTGVIGVPMPMQRIGPKAVQLAQNLGAATPLDVAKAIMTTDTYPKIAQRDFKSGKKKGTLLGICKGAGMIAPNMATMLCFVMTDVAVTQKALKAALREAADSSFNRITVDGDCSTSDTVLAMANGLLKNSAIDIGSPRFKTFKQALKGLLYELAEMIVKDGEGATKLVEVRVMGARTEAQALRAAFAIANSSLVKTAIYGSDPNWGRVLASVGSAGVDLRQDKVSISFNSVKAVSGGMSTGREKQTAEELRKKRIKITVHLGAGRAQASVLTCDLTEQYVRINAEYTT